MAKDDKTVFDPGATKREGDATIYEGAATVADSAATVADSAATQLDDSSMTAAALSDAAGRTDAPVPNLSIQKGDTILGTYKVESNAIKGGMGSVWRMHHTGWNTDLAMKRPQPQCFATEKSKADFIHECEAWINLGLHPNIVSCYYVREISGTPSIFSEWMDGGSLESAIHKGTLYAGTEAEQQERILDIAIQFARGLHYAHEAGLIHQDVKPDNLLLTREGDAKVADFGLAKARAILTVVESTPNLQEAADSGKTIASPSGGYTPAYCSMEQMDGKKLTRRTDIYSWAVSVMELYIGSRPWANGVVAGLSCGGYFEDTKLPMPEALQELLATCMEAEPDDRPHDFAEIETKLHEVYRAETGSDYPRPAPKAAADTADSLNNRALSFIDLGKSEEAEKLWERAAVAEPNHAETRFNSMLAKCRRENNNDYNALIDIQSAIYTLCLGQPSAQSYYLLGMLSLAGYGRAEMDFQQAAALAEDAALRARCEVMQKQAERACHQLPVQLSDGSGDNPDWAIPFDVSEDGLRCAVSYSYVYCGDESEQRLLLFDLTADRLIAQQTPANNMCKPYLRFEGDCLYLGDMWSGDITAWNAYTLEPMEYEEDTFELPDEKRYVLYDGVREITKPRQITAIRGRETIKSTTGGNELMNNVTGDILIDPHVNRVMGMDSRGWYLHIKFDYGPHPSNDTLDIYDTRVFGQPMEYALCRVSTVYEVLSRADALTAAMNDANTAYTAHDYGKALSALDEAYKLMNSDPSEEWEVLNNAVGLHGVRKRLRGWRQGKLRGAVTRVHDSVYGFEKNANRAHFDEGRIWFTEAGKESSVPCPKECHILKADCVSYDRASHVLCWASDSGELHAWGMAGNRALGTIRFSEPVPPKTEWHKLDLFSFFRPSADYVLHPLRLMLNADASAALLECEVCNPYDEAGDYSNAHKLLLFNLSAGRPIHSTCVANEWMDRDQAEFNQAPYESACFSPDGRSLLIKKEMGTSLWCFCDLVYCDTYDIMRQSPGCFRMDGNSYPDGNDEEEIILDWEYALDEERA